MATDLSTKVQVQEFYEALLLAIVEQVGIDEIFAGCEVLHLDPLGEGIGTFPRYIRVAVAEYELLVLWRGSPTLAVGDYCAVVHLREGNRYEILGASGSTGTDFDANVYLYIWVYDVSETSFVAYTTIAGATAYAAITAGDFILVPPGTYDETFTLVDGVIITEQIPGTVIIHYTGGATAVTCADGGYLQCKEIQVTRGAGQNIAAIDASGLGANETTEIHCELVKATQTGSTAAEDAYCIQGGGTGILTVHANSIELDFTENGGGNSGACIHCNGDTFYIFADTDVTVNSDGSGTTVINVFSEEGVCYLRGHHTLEADGGTTAYNFYVLGVNPIVHQWGDLDIVVTGVGGSGANLSQAGGTVEIIGDCTSAATLISWGIAVDSGTCYVDGKCYSETTGNTGAEIAYAIDCAGIMTLRGDAIAAGLSNVRTGVYVYGGGNITMHDGIASGATYDLHNNASTLTVYGVQFDTFSGAVIFDEGDRWPMHICKYTPTTKLLIPYTTIQSAITAAAANDIVSIPPGTYNESITLKSGVKVVEHISGTAILHSTSANVCVTCANGGYLQVKEIRCTRSGNDTTAVYCSMGAVDVCEIRAELIKASGSNDLGGEEIHGIYINSGVLTVYSNVEADLDSDGNADQCAGIRLDGGTVYLFGDITVSHSGDPIGCTDGIALEGGEVYVRGHIHSSGDDGSFCIFEAASGGIATIWGDCYAEADVGNGDATCVECSNATVTVYGNCTAIGQDTALCLRGNGGTLNGYGRMYAENTNIGGTSAVGVYCAGATMHMHGDCTAVVAGGIGYGAYCAAGTLVVTCGRTSGTTTDLRRDGGTLSVFMVEYDTYSGTITSYYPLPDDGWIGIASGVGARIVFDAYIEPWEDLKTDRWLESDTNTFIGVDVAGADNLTNTAGIEGYRNTFYGNYAGHDIEDGHSNTLIGFYAGPNITGEKYNTFLGAYAGEDNTAENNTLLGYGAGRDNTTGDHHVMIGSTVASISTTGTEDVYIGFAVGNVATSGSYNIAIGTWTIADLTTGSYNTVIGHNAGGGITTGSYNTIIGAQVAGLAANLSNRIIIADGSGSIRIYTDNNGLTGFGTVSPDRLVHSEIADAVTNAVTHAARLTHICSTGGTGLAAGGGVGLEFELETATDGTNQLAATIEALWIDATNATRKSAGYLTAYDVANQIEFYRWAVQSGGQYEAIVNEQQADIDFRIEGDSISHLFYTDATATTENIALCAAAAPNWQAMDRGIFLGDTSAAPIGNPASGGFLYSNAGAGTWRGSGGTITAFGPAGPRCGNCGYDFWDVVAETDRFGGASIKKCAWCGRVYKRGLKSVLHLLTEMDRKELIYE